LTGAELARRGSQVALHGFAAAKRPLGVGVAVELRHDI
jgi:hypothetical protein